MKIKTLILGEYQVNTYLVSDERGNCAIIDPGYEPQTILKAAEGLNICAILLTHGHFDHVGAVREIAAKTNCAVYVHEKELQLPPFLTAGALYYTGTYDEGDAVQIGDLTFTVLHTPGHTAGSVCLKCENVLFSGDTLFASSCGRTDLGGSSAQMRQSLKRLAEISENLTVCCGHGNSTTLDRERAYNPYF